MNSRQTILGVPEPAVQQTAGLMLQRKCDCGQHTIAGGGCSECAKKQGSLQRRAASSTAPNEAPAIVHDVIRSPGQPLDAGTRAFMEPRFGHDFSRVRVHADKRAADVASAVNARAFTMNRNIVFANGQYSPHSESGRRLISHELTHVVQQRAGIHLQSGISSPDDQYERHADEVAAAVAEGRSASKLLNTYKNAYEPSPGRGDVVQRQLDREQQNTEQVIPDDLTPVSADPLLLAASVGIRGVNRADDVAKVQARLLALGLLSQEDFAAESPLDATVITTPANTGVVDSTSSPVPAISIPSDSLTVNTLSDSVRTNVITPDLNVTPNITSATTLTPENVEPTSVEGSSLSATMIAIQEFQRALFSKETVDGNIGPAGPTWRALRTTDEAAFAALKEKWEAKKQQIAAERARLKAESARLKAEGARQVKEDAERKKIAEQQKSKEAEKKSTATANKLLAVYATYLPLASTYINLDESGLARVLAIMATFDEGAVIKVFDALDESDAEQVATEMVRNATVGDLSKFTLAVLLHLRLVIRFGEQTAETEELLGRIMSAVELKRMIATVAEKKTLDTNRVTGSDAIAVIESLQEDRKYRYADFVYENKKHADKVKKNPLWKGATEGNWGGLCATAVSRLFAKITGVSERGNGKDWDGVMKRLIADGKVSYHEEKNPDYEKLPNGSVLVWTTGTYGHVCIVLDGRWYSDFWSKPLHQRKDPKPHVVFVPGD